MTTPPSAPLATRIDDAERNVLQAVFERGEPLVVVDSPPGAGKTSLVEAVAALAFARHLRVVVVTVTNEQAYDVQRRLAVDYPTVRTQLLHSNQTVIPRDLRAGPTGVAPATSGGGLVDDPVVVIGNAAKVALTTPQIVTDFDLLIIDESYQLTWAGFAPLAHLAPQCLLVGDPGQLPPVIKIDKTRFEAGPVKVHWPAPLELLHAHPATRIYQLPATRRLPADTAGIVSDAFYPSLPFESAASATTLGFAAAGMGAAIDEVLDRIAGGATLMCLALPRLMHDHAIADVELSDYTAQIIARTLTRGAIVGPPHGNRPLTYRDIGVVDTHVASGAETTRRLRRAGVGADTFVGTPEVWQGLERPLIVAKHPLSGLGELDDPSLAPGRLCVMLSRHRAACILITRDHVGRDLDEHVQASSRRPVESNDETWDGYRAHSAVWRWLETHDRIVRP